MTPGPPTRRRRPAVALAAALFATAVAAACSSDGDNPRVGQPVRMGSETYRVVDARVADWMPMVPDDALTEPEVWRPSTLYVRRHQLVPESLADMDSWLRVRLEVFSDAPSRSFAKDEIVLEGADGQVYTATFVQDLSRGEPGPPPLHEVVAMAGADELLTTEPFPGGDGSVAVVDAAYAVPRGAENGAALLIRGPSLLESRRIWLGNVPRQDDASDPTDRGDAMDRSADGAEPVTQGLGGGGGPTGDASPTASTEQATLREARRHGSRRTAREGSRRTARDDMPRGAGDG